MITHTHKHIMILYICANPLYTFLYSLFIAKLPNLHLKRKITKAADGLSLVFALCSQCIERMIMLIASYTEIEEKGKDIRKRLKENERWDGGRKKELGR